MRIVTVQFNYPDRSDYKTLLNIFKYSVNKYMPSVEFVEICIEAPPNNSGRELNFMYNGVKLRKWVEYLDSVDDNVIFADCDMMALRSAMHAFDKDFDIAYTERTRIKRIPINGGIIMARPTDKAKDFLRELLRINDKMFKEPKFHEQWRRKYAGMNQAAFGYMLNNYKAPVKLHKYKTLQWNAVDCDWSNVDKSTVFVHTKSRLRKMVLREKPINPDYEKVITAWDDLNREMEQRNEIRRIR